MNNPADVTKSRIFLKQVAVIRVFRHLGCRKVPLLNLVAGCDVKSTPHSNGPEIHRRISAVFVGLLSLRTFLSPALICSSAAGRSLVCRLTTICLLVADKTAEPGRLAQNGCRTKPHGISGL